MDFFDHQDQARKKTGQLVFLFGMAVTVIVVAIYAITAFAVSMMADPRAGADSLPNQVAADPVNLELFVMVGLGTLAVICLGSLYKIYELSAGGETVAMMLGGRRLNQQTKDLAERRLLNVVEEMAIASGVPVPPVYVMDNERSINAFAAGHQPGDAVIGVSRGTLEYLNRDELQGVMAHEFSHILNGDMKMNLRLTGILHGILLLAIIGWYVVRSAGFSSRNEKGGGAIIVIGLALLVVGSVGLLFGKLIKAALSRQREYLADASAVQFTRNPDGIAGALKKIGGRVETSKIKDPHAEEVSHMFFGNAFGERGISFLSLSTHPPLVDRVKRIDASFTGKFPKVKPLVATEEKAPPKAKKAKAGPLDALGTVIDPTGVMGQIGTAGMSQILYAAALLEEMPSPLTNAAHEPYGARAVIYAVLLDPDREIRDKQLRDLAKRAEAPSYRETEQLLPLVDKLPQESKLPLAEMTFPALKDLSPDQYKVFRENVESLAKADGKIDLFEYTIRAMLLRDLDVHFRLSKPTSVRYRSTTAVAKPAAVVLSILAHAGHESEEEVGHAFDLGMAQIKEGIGLLPKSECSLTSLDESLTTLAQAVPAIKRRVMAGCTTCIMADRKVTSREYELLRAVAATLGCPMPPMPRS